MSKRGEKGRAGQKEKKKIKQKNAKVSLAWIILLSGWDCLLLIVRVGKK